MNKKKSVQICPLLRQPCIMKNCKIYHSKFDRCDIDLIAYNLYGLAQALLSKDLKPAEVAEPPREEEESPLDEFLKEDDILKQ